MLVLTKHGLNLLTAIEDEKAKGVDVTTFTPQQTRAWLAKHGLFACSSCENLLPEEARSILKNIAYPDLETCMDCNGDRTLIPGLRI